jgi:hypothetical protein
MRYVLYMVVVLGLQFQFIAAFQPFLERIRQTPREETGIRSWLPYQTHALSSLIEELANDVLASDLKNFLKNYVKNNKFKFGTSENSEDVSLYFLRAFDVFQAGPVWRQVYRENPYAQEFFKKLYDGLGEHDIEALSAFLPDIQTYIDEISSTGFWGSITPLDKKVPLSKIFISEKLVAYANYLKQPQQIQQITNMDHSKMQKFLKEHASDALQGHGYLAWVLKQFGKTDITPSEWTTFKEYMQLP